MCVWLGSRHCCLELGDFDEAIVILVEVFDKVVHLERLQARRLKEEVLQGAYIDLHALLFLIWKEVSFQFAAKLYLLKIHGLLDFAERDKGVSFVRDSLALAVVNDHDLLKQVSVDVIGNEWGLLASSIGVQIAF